MKAMIFAAGLGTRLRPYTDDRPKALVEVGGKPLLEHVLRKLARAGIREVVINVHHFADQVISFLEKNAHFGLEIHISDERELLLDTGGGLKAAARFFEDGKPFLVHNVDILTDLDLEKMKQAHLASGALATLAVSRRSGSRCFLFEPDTARLQGWENRSTGEVRPPGLDTSGLVQRAFGGVHIIEPALLQLIGETGVFSIVEVYLRLAAMHRIIAFDFTGSAWMDVGKAAGMPEAEALVRKWNEA